MQTKNFEVTLTEQNFYGIYGTGGCARSIMPIARMIINNEEIKHNQLVFIDDFSEKKNINGHNVLKLEEFISLKAKSFCFNCNI